MKKLILMSLFAATAVVSNAQMVNDSAVTGASYRNNVWYSLENGFVDTALATNWDIAFATAAAMNNPMTTKIHVNTKVDSLFWAQGTTVANFTSLNAYSSSWTKLFNSDTTWEIGAFNQVPNSGGQTDFGWGEYNQTNHDVEASKVYVVMSGAVAKKIYITLNSVNKRYIFTYANLDNSGQHTDTINLDDYATKNFVYYSLKGDSVADREPATASWDLLFTQYHSKYSMSSTPQLVTGALQNIGVMAAQADVVADTITNYGAYTFKSDINILGSDWKNVDMVNPPFPWIVTDSLVYFIKTVDQDIWKLVFTKFSGSSTGTYYFSKQKLYTFVPPNGVAGVNGKVNTSIALYPNPAVSGQSATVIYSLDGNVAAANIAVYDMSGRTILVNSLNTQAGLHQYQIPTGNLSAGIYIVNVNIAGVSTTQKLVIQ